MERKHKGRDMRRMAAIRTQQGDDGGLSKAVKLGMRTGRKYAQVSNLTNSGEVVSMTEEKAATSTEYLDHSTSTVWGEYLLLIFTSTGEYKKRINKDVW